MESEKQLQSEIGGYISTLMRKHFGKGPTSVYVTLHPEFLTIHLRGFLAPMEKILINQQEQQRVLKTRDLLMNDINSKLIDELKELTGIELAEIYVDWNLEKETGLIMGILKQPLEEEALEWPIEVDKKAFIEKIEEASNNAEKVPGETEAFWLSNQSVLVKRSKILVEIEKELLKNGFAEELRIAKRPLERKTFSAVKLEKIFNREILETFYDWNFEKDIGYMVFILAP